MRRSRARTAGRWALALVLAATAACETVEDAPSHPPRCEPAEELTIERGLKQGYRALFLGRFDEAQAAFEEVVAADPEHPQAREGLRAAAEGGQGDKTRPARERQRGGVVMIGGDPVWIGVPVNTERFRFEEERARLLERRRLGIDEEGAVPSWYHDRTRDDGTEIEPDDTDAAVGLIDLVVLHDTQTKTARASFLQVVRSGASSHFLIDYDGTIYQTLDLALEADHVQVTEIDRRSIAIDLVNPVSTETAPLPDELMPLTASTPRDVVRPLGDFRRVQGKEVQHWGYTEAQMKSLAALLRGLMRVLPKLEASFPKDDSGEVPLGRVTEAKDDLESIHGIVGHLHVSGAAMDPGAGFDWERLRQLLQ